jgi:hypothetical protein
MNDLEEDTDGEQFLSNRQKSRRAKLGQYWCSGCDRSIVGDGESCEFCGYKNKPKKKRESRRKINQYKTYE